MTRPVFVRGDGSRWPIDSGEVMTCLETDQLQLRMFCEDDFVPYQKMCSHPEVCCWVGDGEPLDPILAWRHVAAMLGHWQLRGYGLWAVEEKATGQLIGRVGFINPVGWPRLGLGWTLAADRWGHGFATEAARACLAFGFSQLGFEHVISLIRPSNQADRRRRANRRAS